MDIRDRVCVFSFDECSIAKEYAYDKGTDTLYDPKSKVQCVMIRGLVSSWKQMIFYVFYCNMRTEIIFHIIISNVELARFPVVATVHDLGPTNLKL